MNSSCVTDISYSCPATLCSRSQKPYPVMTEKTTSMNHAIGEKKSDASSVRAIRVIVFISAAGYWLLLRSLPESWAKMVSSEWCSSDISLSLQPFSMLWL